MLARNVAWRIVAVTLAGGEAGSRSVFCGAVGVHHPRVADSHADVAASPGRVLGGLLPNRGAGSRLAGIREAVDRLPQVPGRGQARTQRPTVTCVRSQRAAKIGHPGTSNANARPLDALWPGIFLSGWSDLNRRPLRLERGASGNDEPTLPATDGPPGQSHPSKHGMGCALEWPIWAPCVTLAPDGPRAPSRRYEIVRAKDNMPLYAVRDREERSPSWPCGSRAVSAALLIRALLLAVVVAAGLVVYCYSVTSIKALADTTPGDTRTRPAVPRSSSETRLVTSSQARRRAIR
jgi:hypothetical protein